MLEDRKQEDVQERLQSTIEKYGIDGLILTAPESIFYATGFASSFLYKSHKAGTTAAIVPKEGKISLICSEFEKQTAVSACKGIDIISYPVWIFIEDYATDAEKPAQPDLNQTFRIAAEILKEKYASPVIGIESETISFTKYDYLKSVFGEENLKDAGDALVESRMIKTPWEINTLRKAAEMSEVAMLKTARQVTAGMTEADVMRLFRNNCYEQSPDIIDISQAHTVATDFAPALIPRHNRLRFGDVICLDGGPVYCGYGSDLARTFAVGNQTEKRREEIYSILYKGYERALEVLGPGVPMNTVFHEIQKVVKAEIPIYRRGHHGHSIGCNKFSEEAPFIAPGETRTFEPGMVFCLELPYYSSRNHSYNIEDTFVVTENGVEFFTHANPTLYI